MFLECCNNTCEGWIEVITFNPVPHVHKGYRVYHCLKCRTAQIIIIGRTYGRNYRGKRVHLWTDTHTTPYEPDEYLEHQKYGQESRDKVLREDKALSERLTKLSDKARSAGEYPRHT